MHKARAFFFVCAGIFLLTLAYRNAAAQSPSNPAACVAGDGEQIFLMTAGGDAYYSTNWGWAWLSLGNCFGAPRGSAPPPGNPVVAVAGRTGAYLAATALGRTYVSRDDGVTWTLNTTLLPGDAVGRLLGSRDHGAGYFALVLASGEAYYSGDWGTTWTPTGDCFTAPTPAQGTTWGQLKTTYR